MRGARWSHAVAIAFALALTACTTFEATVDPKLYGAPAEKALVRMPGAVRIRMPSDASALFVTVGGLGGFDANRVRMPVGELVLSAAELAFDLEFAGGVSIERTGADVASTAAAAAPRQVVVAPGAIHFDFRDDFVYFIPLGPLSIERRDLTVRLAVEVRVLDEAGAVRWSRSYDAGRELWKPSWTSFEARNEGVRRIAHEQAYRLLRRAAHDVRLFVEADRRRERIL